MSMLLFAVGDNSYALDNHFVLRIIPHVSLKTLPHASPNVLGILNFSGLPVPVIDFCQLIAHRPTKNALDSRIIILCDPDALTGMQPLLGVLGEKVSQIVSLHPGQFIETNLNLQQTSYLDGVYNEGQQMIQKVNVRPLFHYLSHELTHLQQLSSPLDGN